MSNDCLCHVLSYLDPFSDLALAQRVSRAWRTCGRETERLYVQRLTLDDRASKVCVPLAVLDRWKQRLMAIDVVVQLRSSDVMPLLEYCGAHLTSLRIDAPFYLKMGLPCMPRLRRLTVLRGTVYTKWLAQVLPAIRVLNLGAYHSYDAIQWLVQRHQATELRECTLRLRSWQADSLIEELGCALKVGACPALDVLHMEVVGPTELHHKRRTLLEEVRSWPAKTTTVTWTRIWTAATL